MWGALPPTDESSATRTPHFSRPRQAVAARSHHSHRVKSRGRSQKSTGTLFATGVVGGVAPRFASRSTLRRSRMGGMLPEEHRDDVREEAEGEKHLPPSAPHNSITTLCDMPSVPSVST